MKIFISYAHENKEHKDSVLKLADSFRRDGLTAEIDQYLPGSPPESWPAWMERMLATADKVLIVFSQSYQRRWEGEEEKGKGLGVSWESLLIRNDLYDAQGRNTKFIPIILSLEDKAYIPRPLTGDTFYLVQTPEQYWQLYAALTGQFETTPGPVGHRVTVKRQKERPVFPFLEEAMATTEQDPGARGGAPIWKAAPPASLQEILKKHQERAREHSPLGKGNVTLSEDLFERYSTLFERLVETKVPVLRETSLFQKLADFALVQPEDVLRIQGDSGTGRSSLLALLYLYYRSQPAGKEGRTVPFFLSLGEYDIVLENEALERCRQDMAEIEFVLQNYPEEGARFVLLIDGLDDCLDFRHEVEKEVGRLSHPSLKRVVGIGLGIPSPGRPQKYRFEWGNTPLLTLRSLPPQEEQEVAELLDSFFRTLPYAEDATARKAFEGWLDRFQFSQINLRTLSMLRRLQERETYRGINSLFGLLDRYCREFLAPAGEYEVLLPKTAALAYAHHYDGKKLPAAQQRGNRSWALIHCHADVRDFLLADHTLGALLGAGVDGADLSALNRTYPYSITRHAKGLVSSSLLVQTKAVEAARKALQSGEAKVRANVAYFLGRLTDSGIRKRAVELLWQLLRTVQEEKSTDPDASWLLRTIYVSLIYLGDRKASREYIQGLVENPAWDQINRGFHLEYYGDIEVAPSADFIHQDPVVPFPRTYERLYESIRKHLDSRGHTPWELEVYTLYSLAQKRHAAGALDQQVRRELLALLGPLLEKRLDSDILREYLQMLKIHFQKDVFSVGGVFEDLYQVKAELRRGWVTRGLQETEHVADHMYGAYLLGLLLLPNQGSESGYDKATILKTILIHDLAEAYTGDVVSGDKRQGDREAEAFWFSYLGMLGTYVEVADTLEIARLARNYEAKSDINARIARDLDKLDVYIQMHLYRRRGEIHDFDAWKEEIGRGLTSQGKRILGLLEKHFESGGGSAAGLKERVAASASAQSPVD